MDTQTQIERLIELAIVQRTELKQLVEQLPQLREHLNAEVERTIEEVEPQLRAELEEFCDKRAVDANAKVGSALEAKIVELSKALELTTQARYNAIKEQERKVEELRQLAAKQIEGHVAALPEAVKEIVGAELARFPRAGEIDQLRKEFAEPRGLNPRGKWLPSETYNKLDLVTWNGDSYVSNIDGNRERPARNSSTWTLSAARGIGGGGPSDLSALTAVPSNGSLLIGSGTSWVNGNIVAGAGINVTNGAGSITISATDGDITLDDGTAASPSLHFTNDADTGIYRPAANTLGISVSGTQVAYFDQNGLTIPNAGIEAGGSLHAANGNANNPSLSFTGDQDTGFFRHQPNELGIALGGTQYATLTSTTFSVTPALSVAGVSRVTNSTASSSTSTGALVVTGGVGIGGAQYVGGNLTVSGQTSIGTVFNVDTGNAAGTRTLQFGSTFNSGTFNFLNGASTIMSFTSGRVHFNNTARTEDGGPTSPGWGFYNDAGNMGLYRISANNLGFSINNANAATLNTTGLSLVGNLTVSGTVAPAGVWTGAASIGVDGTDKVTLGYLASTVNGAFVSANNSAASAYAPLNLGGTSVIFRLGTTETARFAATSGNLLLGTTTDSSNGKLQLATHTTSAGGIGFGTDTALYRISAGTLALDHLAGTGPNLEWRESGTAKLRIQTVSGDAYISTASAASLYLRTNSTAALTLDGSTQNATFAGSVTVSGADKNVVISSTAESPALLWTASGGNAANRNWRAIINNSENGDWGLYQSTTAGGAASTKRFSFNQSGDATFSGAIAIGNTVAAAASVASTHKVTISIGGVTYYLLASNV